MSYTADEQIASREEAFRKFLDVLYKISGESFNNLNEGEFIKLVVTGIKQLGFDRASVWLLDEATGKLCGTWGTDRNGNLVDEGSKELPFESLPPVHGYTIRITKKSQNDTYGKKLPSDIFLPKGEEDRFEEIWGNKPSYPGYYARVKEGDNISLPIVVSGKAIGSIGVDNFIAKRQIEKEDLDILAMFTANMGIILHNIRLVEQIYKQRDMERQIVQLEKMSDLGQLIAGVVHELNNTLTGVIGYSGILLNADCDEKTKHTLTIINTEAYRCFKIAEGLLSFSRQYEPTREYVQINDIIQSTLNIRKYQLHLDNIEIELNLSDEVPKTMVDPHRMQQVFMNIINNAQQAMTGNADHGKLVVETKLKNNKIVISFSDTGPGISKENLDKIFDPFFTTKAIGKGTGLGLNISKTIIKDHGGSIKAENKEGAGAIFTIALPVISKKPKSIPMKEFEERKPEKAEMALKILVVDDEQRILELFIELLRMLGHKTDVVNSGNQAIDKINKEKYDLIICDMKMPELGGEELYNLIKSQDAKLAERIIFTTGDTVNIETQNFLQNTGNLCISKPFTIDDVKQVITKIAIINHK